MEILKARLPQSCTQIPQALQNPGFTVSSNLIFGFDQRERCTGAQIFPPRSLTAEAGQTLPQTPHSTQRRGFIS
jgi:hypothetical protein